MTRTMKALVGAAMVSGVWLLGGVLAAESKTKNSAYEDLASDDPLIRENAIKLIAEKGSSEVGELLNALDSEPLLIVKSSLGDAIRRIGLPSAKVDAVRGMLKASEASTRAQAVLILGAAHPVTASADLLAVVTDAKEAVPIRASAAVAAGRTGGNARSGLEKLSGDKALPESVRQAAIRGLSLTAPSDQGAVGAIVSDGTRSHADRQAALSALTDTSVAARSNLEGLLSSKEVWVRAEVVAALAVRQETDSVSKIVALVSDNAPEVRLSVLRSVIRLGAAKNERSSVIQLLTDADPRVQALAAETVGMTCVDIATGVTSQLKNLLGSGNFEVRRQAALALRAFGDRSGAATMLADQATANPSQAIEATQAYNQIQAQ